MPDPVDDGGDPDDNDGIDSEIQGVDTDAQEPTMIGDRAPPPAIHSIPEEAVLQPMELEDIAVQPTGLETTEPPHEVTASTLVEPEATAPLPPLTPAPVLPGTERELH